MIKRLAKILRGVHLVIGVSAPPPGASDRTYVYVWLGVIAAVVIFCVLLFYAIPFLYFHQ